MLIAGLAVAAALTAATPTTPACIDTVTRGAAVVADVLDRQDVPDGWSWEIRCGDSGADYWGLTDDTTVTVWPDMAPTRDELEDLVLHELGHVWAWELDESEKVWWVTARGGEWNGDWAVWDSCTVTDHCGDEAVEDWAEAWSHCTGHGDPARHWGQYGTVPTDKECGLVEGFLVRDSERPEPGAG